MADKSIILVQPSHVPDTEVSIHFLQRMVDRMSLSFLKYGPVKDGFPAKVDAVATLRLCLDKYAETGNTEYLVDAANYAMIESIAPRHERTHYEALDSRGSAGRQWHDGHVGQTANTPGHENARLGGSARTTSGGFYKREGD